MNCPNCGKNIDNDSQFCEYCGAKIEKSKRGLWITLAVIALFALVGCSVYMYNVQQESLRIERQRLEEENRRAAERQAELEAQLKAERIAKEKAEQARRVAEQKAKDEAEQAKTKNSANGHEWVDLALPSGTKWATKNVGATTPEGYGNYYAWGETTTKFTCSSSTYKWCRGSDDTMTKYCTSSSYGIVDNKTTLDLSDDAAYVNWGSSWRMPTLAEQDELSNTSYTTWTWTTQNGVKGYKVTSKSNGNSIFLPAAGYRFDSSLYDAGSNGKYWSSSLNTDYSDRAYFLILNSSNVCSTIGPRFSGFSVRPVLR
jgi:predicted nucleic acid-binding Zn ribbon protein